MSLNPNDQYFLIVSHCVLRNYPKETTTKNALNELILGDSVTFLGETSNEWIKVFCRRNTGWIKEEWITDKQLLEINFVDIGQGDGCHIVTPENEIILLDAGEGLGFSKKGGDHMLRFMSWRYNLRNDVILNSESEEETITIKHAVITHPDLDHFYGFHSLFEHPKLKFKNIYHNGIVERSIKEGSSSTWLHDFGRKVPPFPYKRKYHLWDTVTTHQELIEILEKQKESGKYYLRTLLAAYNNHPDVQFHFLSRADNFLANYDKLNELEIEVITPITESIYYKGETKDCLVSFGSESETKNGHSITFQFRIGNLKIMLGGDLNTKAQDYLARYYCNSIDNLSDLENKIKKLKNDISASTKHERSKMLHLEKNNETLKNLISQLNKTIGCDIVKACHHGSGDSSNSFLKALNPIATIISSGDGDSHAHPRPDTIGAYAKYSRSPRPLIFSTELGRSTKEFSYPFRFYELLKKLEARKNELSSKKDKDIYQNRMENLRDSNIVRYGLITLRTNGDITIIAQKIETPTHPSKKWDVHVLKWNKTIQKLEYVSD